MAMDELKLKVAQEAFNYVENSIERDTIIGVGTGSTANFFIEELGKIASRLEGAVASSEETARRLKSCLLYTSPSPRDLSTSRMPSSA